MENNIGKKVVDISSLVDIFEAQEGEIQQIIGKTGNGKTYEATRRALEYLKQGYVVYTTWQMVLPDIYDERSDGEQLFFKTLLNVKKFFVFDYKKNWQFLDIERSDLDEFVAGLTDCIVMLDEGQDIFDSYEGTALSKEKRKSLTRTRHMRKTLIIISQRAQAVAVTARANVTYFYKCVKTVAWFWPFVPYFKVYRTEEMDQSNFPVWESEDGFKAELWRSHFGKKEVYDSYNSWYLRAGIPKSQEVYFDAYELTFIDKLKAIWTHIRTGKEKRAEEKERQMEKFRIIMLEEGAKKQKWIELQKHKKEMDEQKEKELQEAKEKLKRLKIDEETKKIKEQIKEKSSSKKKKAV